MLTLRTDLPQESTDRPSNNQISLPAATEPETQQPGLPAAKAASIHSRLSQLGGTSKPPLRSTDSSGTAATGSGGAVTAEVPVDVSFIEVGDSGECAFCLFGF